VAISTGKRENVSYVALISTRWSFFTRKREAIQCSGIVGQFLLSFANALWTAEISLFVEKDPCGGDKENVTIVDRGLPDFFVHTTYQSGNDYCASGLPDFSWYIQCTKTGKCTKLP
jgi:hypothetical protein